VSKKNRVPVPLGDRVLVQREEAVTKTESGLYVPEAAQTPQLVAKVVALGPDTGPVICVNDEVIFQEWAGQDLELDGKKWLILRLADIAAVLREEE
jgi:chaperonin GroES